MKLTGLALNQVRRFRTPLNITDLEPGLNLFTGPNESGKSTLVEAIRAAFFERHRSTTVQHLQPWDDSSAAPEIELRFDWANQPWRLSKRFLKQPRCDLKIGGDSLDGDEAEDRLAALFGYELPKRGASKPEHQGIPGLLWITQGSGQEISDAVSHAGQHLQGALSSTLGELTSSSDELINQVSQERDQLLTKAGKPRNAYKDASESCSQLEAEIAELKQRIHQYRDQVDQLAELREAHQQSEREQPWKALRQQAESIGEQLKQAEALESEQQHAQRQLTECLTNQKALQALIDAQQRAHKELAERKRAQRQAVEQLQSLQARDKQVQQRLDQARQAHEQSRLVLQQARAADQRQRQLEALKTLDQTLQAHAERVEKARALQQSLTEHMAAHQRAQVDTNLLKAARQRQREIDTLQIQRDAVATRLSFALQTDQALQLNGEPLSGSGERRLSETTEIDIAGVGQLTIHPGGEDIAELNRQQQGQQDQLQALLEQMGCKSLTEAEQRAEQAQNLVRQIEHDRQRLRDLAEDGLDALVAEQASLQQQAESARQRLAELPGDDHETNPTALPIGEAEHQHDMAAQALSQASNAEQSHRRDLEIARQAASSAERELQQKQASIEASQQQASQAGEDLATKKTEQTRLEQDIETRQKAIEQAKPDILRQDIERLGRSAEQLQALYHQRARELASLQSRVETLGAEGLEEALASCQAEHQRGVRHRDALARRAAALDLLLNTLNHHRQQLIQRLQAPLQKHLNHYLRLLFADGTLQVDENLRPISLLRQNDGLAEHADFQALSFGTREQTALISRLAYADLLKIAGHPTLIILDDSLVHSDPTRLSQMKRVLFDAATRHQILLFTCHPNNWNDLGASPRDIRQLQDNPNSD